MKKFVLAFCGILFLQILSAQKIITKKKKIDEDEGKAIFYVLASNDAIKQGSYEKKAYTGNRVLLKGNYDNNKKTGLWEEQYYGKMYAGPKAKGFYTNDVKTGEWIYFNYEGDTAQIYDWTTNKLVFSDHCDGEKKEYTVVEDNKESKQILDCPPTCVSGKDYFLYEFMRSIAERVEFFDKIGSGLYQLKTKIFVTINSNSSVVDVTFSTAVKPELKEIADQFIRSYPWIAGRKDGKPITSKFEFAVNMSSQF